MRLDISRVQEEPVVELVALTNTLHVGFDRGVIEAIIDCVVNDIDLIGWNREKPQDVTFRCLRDRKDASRSVSSQPKGYLRIAVGESAGKILGEQEVDTVVDSDY